KAQTFLGGGFAARAKLDLNSYYVVALNHDATVGVVDPLFGYGGSKLLALVPLESPGEDWVLDASTERLFVTLPASSAVAVIETRTWKLAGRVATPPRPGRIALQPDGGYVWVVCAGEGAADGRAGVIAIDPRELEPVAEIATGREPTAIELSG